MHVLRTCLLAFLVFVAVPLPAATGNADWLYRGSDIARDEAWQFGTLPNGLRYAVRRNPLPAGQVSIRLRIAAGALHEEDHERGWAHFVEHMAFRGSEGFADGEARRTWQKLGASFGSDTNATTSPTQTVYQLDLPHADRASLDLSLRVIAAMADTALFDPAIVEAERKVILSERRRRAELTNRIVEATYPLFYAGLKFADRDTIGTEATLNAADSAGLKAFYERWYRPDRATVVMVGDADPAMMAELIAARFGGWQPSGPPPAEPDYGAPADPPVRVATVAYPGVPHHATIAWIRPYVARPNTREREAADLATSLAARIINRRLEAKARGDAAYVTAGMSQSRSTDIADMTQLLVTARGNEWRTALGEAFAILGDALRAPPSEAEIARELRNLRIAGTAAVEGEPTVLSQRRAAVLIAAIDGNSIVTTAATQLALIDEFTPLMTPDKVGEAMKDLVAGAGPRMVMLSPDPITPDTAEAALAEAERVAPAARMADREVSMDALPPLGPPGREVSREEIADLGVTIVRFSNGSTLTFKRTDFEKGSVQVQLRFGHGLAGLSPTEKTLSWASSAVGPSGLADLDLDGLERLLTGRRMGLTFGVAEDAFVLAGQTNGTDLADQLRLLSTKLAFPRWDAAYFRRLQTNALQNYDLAFASATARAGRELPGFVRNGDARWRPVEREEIAAADPAAFEAFFAPILAAGPVEAVIVGDVDLETAVAAMSATVGALPERPIDPIPPESLAVRPPPPSPEPAVFTHNGDPAQAFAAIGWTTIGGLERRQERRALGVAANLLQVRLYDRLREVEGATYSPNAVSSTSENFPDYGVFYAVSEVRPESIETMFRLTREIVADLAANPPLADEFARAINPILSGIERRVATNAYWVGALRGWPSRPELIDSVRAYLSDYREMTPEKVRDAVRAHVADAGDWSMVVRPAKEGGSAQ